MFKIEQSNTFSNLWRNAIFLLLLFLTIGLVAFFVIHPEQKQETASKSVTLDTDPVVFNQKEQPTVEQGAGDVVVREPEIKPKLPQLVAQLPIPEDFTADRIIVKDVKTGIVLYAKDAYQSWPIASMTKLMTALVLREKSVDMGELVEVTSNNVVDTHMYAGDIYARDEVWKAMLIGSSNKAAVTLVEHIWGDMDVFMARMNEKARELGMSDTSFADPTGLDASNVSTPSDMVILLNEALKDPYILDALQRKELDLFSKQRQKKHHIWNTNWILLGWIPTEIDVVAGKTGFINQSQYNFTARFQTQDGRLLDVVIMGADMHEARFTEARDVIAASTGAYTWPE